MTDLAVQPVSAASFVNDWERQEGEPARAWRAFVIFRDMGDERGVRAVRDVAGGPYSHKSLMQWAETYRWVDRSLAYDRMLDRRRLQAKIDEVEAMARRQVHIGQTLQERGLQYVKEQLDSPEQRAKNLGANAALRFIDRGVELEREGLGMDDKGVDPTVNVQVNVLDSQAKADVFDKITEMANNMAAVEKMIAERNAPPVIEVEDIDDAELVE